MFVCLAMKFMRPPKNCKIKNVQNDMVQAGKMEETGNV